MVKEEFSRNIDFSCRLPDGRPMHFEVELSDWMKMVMADMGDEIDCPISGNVIHNGEYYDLWTILTEHFAVVEDKSNIQKLKNKLADLKQRHKQQEQILEAGEISDDELIWVVKKIAWLEVEMYNVDREMEKEGLL